MNIATLNRLCTHISQNIMAAAGRGGGSWLKKVDNLIQPMIRENRQLVTEGLVDFEK